VPSREGVDPRQKSCDRLVAQRGYLYSARESSDRLVASSYFLLAQVPSREEVSRCPFRQRLSREKERRKKTQTPDPYSRPKGARALRARFWACSWSLLGGTSSQGGAVPGQDQPGDPGRPESRATRISRAVHAIDERNCKKRGHSRHPSTGFSRQNAIGNTRKRSKSVPGAPQAASIGVPAAFQATQGIQTHAAHALPPTYPSQGLVARSSRSGAVTGTPLDLGPRRRQGRRETAPRSARDRAKVAAKPRRGRAATGSPPTRKPGQKKLRKRASTGGPAGRPLRFRRAPVGRGLPLRAGPPLEESGRGASVGLRRRSDDGRMRRRPSSAPGRVRPSPWPSARPK